MEQTTSAANKAAYNNPVQQTSLAALHAAAQVQQAIDKLIDGWLEAGFSSYEIQTRLAKEYLGGLQQTRREWTKKTTEITEKTLAVDYPLKREWEEFNTKVMEGMKKGIEIFSIPFAAAAKK
ncbi:MAG: hypothetical protein AB1489_02630 [Acidobacteriota bacterium]